ncbi:hypothetical protein CAPTEDRAFT_196938 [Capitella teleta]|uniref:Endonuclease/exonuclease/phosphatase domain-containing protein n=1 Tax=Capitella teleta TaxID=283909 RepID=R7V7B4_CAPTE|nr:hypothetical protein CAPTEDRAFT_196938 [Capitella teleta]|eukprot:ELU14352.1 hypothetical protein CAPTEDRAFT_196938 [Capitella teleta]
MKIISLNWEGFKRSKLYIKDLLTMRQPDFLCLQETWLINETAGLIAVDTDYLHVHKSGMDSRQEVTMGRPKGGTVILYRSDFGKKSSHDALMCIYAMRQLLYLSGGSGVVDPNTKALYKAMKRSRHQYHYAVRLARKNEFATKKNSLAEKIKSGADFWRELQKINPCSKMTPQAIDDADSPQEIADMFGKKYSELYTGVPTDADEMVRMRAIFSENSAREDPRLVFCTAEDIRLVLRKLKSGKGDGSLGFDSDHIINGSSMLFLFADCSI